MLYKIFTNRNLATDLNYSSDVSNTSIKSIKTKDF